MSGEGLWTVWWKQETATAIRHSSINLPSSRKRRRQAWKRRGDLGAPQRQPEQPNRG
jgi:hypothetical protein